MSIEKITISETEWKDGIRIIKEKEYLRDEYRGDFEGFILQELADWDIQDYAEKQLDMIKEKNCPKTYVDDFDTEDLIEELKDRGFDVIECKTLTDAFKLEKVKELMQFS